MIFCKLIQHLVSAVFDDLLVTHGVENRVSFVTQISGSLPDPVIKVFQPSRVMCEPVGSIGSLDHFAVLSTMLLEGTILEMILRKVLKINLVLSVTRIL